MNLAKILVHPHVMKAVTDLFQTEFDDCKVTSAQAVMENKRPSSTAVQKKFGRGSAGLYSILF